MKKLGIGVLALLGLGVGQFAISQEGQPRSEGREGQRGEGPRGEGRGREGGREGGREEGRGRGDFGGMFRNLPVMVALDADQNGEISAEELEKATAALKKLDKNGDGKVSADELRPTPPAGFGGPGGPGGNQNNAEEMVKQLMANDKNGDGKLAKDEVSGRMQAIVERADADKDGFATKEELTKAIAAQSQGGRGGERGGERGGFGRPGGEPFAPPSPEAFVNRFFEFDADKDGKLSREELTKMFASGGMFGGRGGRPGEGRPGEGRPEGERRRPDAE